MISKSSHQNEISKSAERRTFQKNSYIERCKQKNITPDPEELDMYDRDIQSATEMEQDPAWCNNNLEYDLRSNDWILEKARKSKVYAQNIYAALCNTDWQRTEPWPILKNETWSCSWRYAGGIVADMRQKGDYIDWYCSGIRNDSEMDDDAFQSMTKEQQEIYLQSKLYVSEGTVTDEIKADFLKLGWQLVWNDESK